MTVWFVKDVDPLDINNVRTQRVEDGVLYVETWDGVKLGFPLQNVVCFRVDPE